MTGWGCYSKAHGQRQTFLLNNKIFVTRNTNLHQSEVSQMSQEVSWCKMERVWSLLRETASKNVFQKSWTTFWRLWQLISRDISQRDFSLNEILLLNKNVFLYRNHNVARHLEKLLQPVSGKKTASLLDITSTLPIELNCSRVLAASRGDRDWFQNFSKNNSHNKTSWYGAQGFSGIELW